MTQTLDSTDRKHAIIIHYSENVKNTKVRQVLYSREEEEKEGFRIEVRFSSPLRHFEPERVKPS